MLVYRSRKVLSSRHDGCCSFAQAGRCSVAVFSKGQCETSRFRFLAKHGGYVWVVTQATLLYAGKAHRPQSVVCVNFVIR